MGQRGEPLRVGVTGADAAARAEPRRGADAGEGRAPSPGEMRVGRAQVPVTMWTEPASQSRCRCAQAKPSHRPGADAAGVSEHGPRADVGRRGEPIKSPCGSDAGAPSQSRCGSISQRPFALSGRTYPIAPAVTLAKRKTTSSPAPVGSAAAQRSAQPTPLHILRACVRACIGGRMIVCMLGRASVRVQACARVAVLRRAGGRGQTFYAAGVGDRHRHGRHRIHLQPPPERAPADPPDAIPAPRRHGIPQRRRRYPSGRAAALARPEPRQELTGKSPNGKGPSRPGAVVKPDPRWSTPSAPL